MKKYIKPSIMIVTLTAIQTMLAGSADTNASDVGLSSTTVDNNNAYSRGGSFWDDDDY